MLISLTFESVIPFQPFEGHGLLRGYLFLPAKPCANLVFSHLAMAKKTEINLSHKILGKDDYVVLSPV